MNWDRLCYLSGISDLMKIGPRVVAPAWMGADEKKQWNKGKRYALRQMK